jgi:homopolymeric O-antigen transport system permease protein
LATAELVIKPSKGWHLVDLRELWRYRELLGFFIWRDVKIRYKQTLLGGLWALLQPLIAMLVFTLVFNRVANFQGDGSPYALFVFSGLVPWTFFTNAVGLASNSLVGNENMIRKIYFPRVLIPLAMIGALGLDMLIGLGFTGCLMAYYHWPITTHLLWLPVCLLGVFLTSSGIGLILAAMNVQYRDVKYVVPFVTQMALFLTPVIYPVSHFPAQYRFLLALNPMTGMIESFRYALLGSPVSWPLIWSSFGEAAVVFLLALFFFRRLERSFADII